MSVQVRRRHSAVNGRFGSTRQFIGAALDGRFRRIPLNKSVFE
jgi:hypothetical protein